MSKRQMIESLLSAYEYAISAGEPKECAEQFVKWMYRVGSALDGAGMPDEARIWREAQEDVRFNDDDNSFPAEAESMKGILTAFLANLAPAESFVNWERLDELRAVKSGKFDFTKLIRLCEELNSCYASGCYFAVAPLIRAILNHVPPIFGCKNFAEVCNNYRGSKSFKEAMNHLDNSCRKIADAYLHEQIRSKEILPNQTQVNFSGGLDVLLAEIVRILKD